MSKSQSPKMPRAVARLEGPLTKGGGSTVHVRAIRTDDLRSGCAHFHHQLSPDAIIFRFFHFLPELPVAGCHPFHARGLCEPHGARRDHGYGRSGGFMGVVVMNASQRQWLRWPLWWKTTGKGTWHLLPSGCICWRRCALSKGITTFVAITMGNNTRMI